MAEAHVSMFFGAKMSGAYVSMLFGAKMAGSYVSMLFGAKMAEVWTHECNFATKFIIIYSFTCICEWLIPLLAGFGGWGLLIILFVCFKCL